MLSSIRIRRDRGGGGCRSGAFVVQMHKENSNSQGESGGDDQGEPAIPAEFGFEQEGYADGENIHDGQRNQNVPAEMHKLIEAIAWQGKPEPHENVDVSGHLQEEPEG